MKIYFDGGCKPNPGKMELAVVDETGKVLAYEKLKELGTNNEAEWLALITAMMICKEQKIKDATIIGDSMLVVNQANGTWKIKAESMKAYKEEFEILKKEVGKVTIEYIPRAANLAGIYIEEVN